MPCHYPTCQRRYSCLRIVLTAQYHMGVSRPDLLLAEYIQNQLAASVHCTYRNSRTGPGSNQSAIPWRMSWNTEHQLSLKASRTSFIRRNFQGKSFSRGGLWHLNSERVPAYAP